MQNGNLSLESFLIFNFEFFIAPCPSVLVYPDYGASYERQLTSNLVLAVTSPAAVARLPYA